MALIGMRFSFGFFIGSPIGVFVGTPPWMAPLEVLLGGFLFWIFTLGISMLLSMNLTILLVGLLVLDSVANKLNPVRRELLHLWRTFLAYWIVAGNILPCLIFVTLLFSRCMPYWICSVAVSLLCNRSLLHVVPMMLYNLADCVLLSLFLVGQRVCGCNQILSENIDWLLLDVVIFPTIEVGSLYLRCIVQLWSDFWRSEWISLHWFLCDYFGAITDTWC